jgi:magnesium chelatase subunit D
MRFTDVCGLDSVKHALLLLAVDPLLGGCVMAAPAGSGKSTLARAFAALVRASSPVAAPFVELPVNTTEDRLIGGLDLEATLARGERVIEHGLLARAHGGVLYADGVNRLDSAIEAALIDTLSRGEVRIERDGLSLTQPARFMLLATYDPADGELRRGLADRVGLIMPFTPAGDTDGRAEVLRMHARLRPDFTQADVYGDDSDDAQRMLVALLAEARRMLPTVCIDDAQVKALAVLSSSLGVEGNRADVFAVRAALASAALGGRERVDDEDLRCAARCVLTPRATRLPKQKAEPQQTQQAQPEPQTQPSTDDANDAQERSAPPHEQTPPEAMLLSAVQTDLPADVLALPFAQARRSRSGSRGEALNRRRGRFIRAVPGAPRDGRIALTQTLLAAAPWQRLRADTQPPTASHRQKPRVSLKASDVRVKRFRDKAGTLFVFIVDASGSMALNRMREAKGAAAALLQNAYVHRDQVALIACRGQASTVLLPPSTSVDRAKRELDVMPTGGATPLAHALLSGWQLARQMRGRGVHQTSLVLMTDGRGNVPLSMDGAPATKSSLAAELQQLASLVRADGIKAIVIDTQSNYLSRGEGPALARALDGRYVYLPNAKAAQIAALAVGAADAPVKGGA